MAIKPLHDEARSTSGWVFVRDSRVFIHSNLKSFTEISSEKVTTPELTSLSRMGESQELRPDDTEPGKEKQAVAAALGDFAWQTSEAWAAITRRFGSGVTRSELNSIANVIIAKSGLPELSRAAQRSYPVLIKWFQDHLAEIALILPLIELRDQREQTIDSEREQRERFG